MTSGRLWIDLETRARVDLRTTTPYRYAEDPDFSVMMAGWSLDDGVVSMAVGREPIMDIVRPMVLDSSIVKVAHNAPFERICLSAEFGLPSGKYLPIEEFHDTQAVAGEKGYPQSLSKLARALGGEQKDEAGTRLINLFCKPNRKGGWNGPDTHPVDWLDFLMYCEQDVYTLIDVDRMLGDFPTETERQVYWADQRINDRGIRIDVRMARQAMVAAEENKVQHEAEFRARTEVENPASQPQVMAWCRRVGLKNKDLRKETIEGLLARDLHPDVRRVLELRQELALVASKKFSTALGSVSPDDRLRGSFRFFGAHTGRWAGRGTQVHNLPRAQLKSPTLTQAAILDLELGLGGDAHTLKALVRAMFLGPMTVVDYSAIEARVISWIAGEEWALEAFRAGRDIYVETAERMSTPTTPLDRSQGKIAVLALGYNGAVGSLRAMGAEGTDEELLVLVRQWRKSNPRIVRLWEELGRAFLNGGRVGRYLNVERDGKDRMIRLPSGRAICYRSVSNSDGGPSFIDKNGQRVRTYGGRLAENVTQAIARDLLAEAMVRLEQKGFEVVGHVHDEVLVDGEYLDEVTELMVASPQWATGLPVDAEGFVTDRYRKG